jgi:hypothetical protein
VFNILVLTQAFLHHAHPSLLLDAIWPTGSGVPHVPPDFLL